MSRHSVREGWKVVAAGLADLVPEIFKPAVSATWP
jgi:hypothetical protein